MRKISVIMAWVLLAVGAMTVTAFAEAEDYDKYDRWFGPYNGVSCRYGWSYLGNDKWCSYQNFVHFWNGNNAQAKITYYNTLNGVKRGPYIQYLEPSNDKNPGIKISISEGEEVKSIVVEFP